MRLSAVTKFLHRQQDNNILSGNSLPDCRFPRRKLGVYLGGLYPHETAK